VLGTLSIEPKNILMTVPVHFSLFPFSLVVTAIAYRLLRTRMGSALSQKLVSTATATATNSNTTVRFSGLEATATAAASAATAAGGQQQADPAATSSHSSQGRISNIKKIYFYLCFIR
jgi:hypothetical protein